MKLKEGNILIVDDQEDVLKALNLCLKYEFEWVKAIKNPNQIPNIIENNNVDVLLLDMNFTAGLHSGNEGLYWLNQIMKLDSEIVVILITAYGDVQLAVNAIKNGATDFILKPWDDDKLITSIRNGIKLRRSNKKVAELESKQAHLNEDLNRSFKNFIGNSIVMQEVFRTIEKVAKTNANILILGENGTGKELVAREIHKQSLRSNELFVSTDLSALNENIFESEMFGHIKGAFTDARENRIGRFVVASKGTLFLDEIGNLSLNIQSKILTALQNREVTPLGSNKASKIDIRLICASNKNLQGLIKQDLFREDLLYRINTIQITLPPLRERADDVLLLAEHFLIKYGDKYDKKAMKISGSAIEKLKGYSWPGNVRELEHTMEKAVIMADSKTIKSADLYLDQHSKTSENDFKGKNLASIEKEVIAQSIENHKGNMSRIAKELGVTRTTLYNKIRKYDL